MLQLIVEETAGAVPTPYLLLEERYSGYAGRGGAGTTCSEIGRGVFNRVQSPHRFRLPFSLLLSFGQAKERREQYYVAFLKNDNIICMGNHPIFCFDSEVRSAEPHSRYTDNLAGWYR